MSQEVTPETETGASAPPETSTEPMKPNENHTRHDRRGAPFACSTRNFEGTTPKIGGVFGLRSESATKKISCDDFLEKLGIHIMKESKGGEHIAEVTK